MALVLSLRGFIFLGPLKIFFPRKPTSEMCAGFRLITPCSRPAFWQLDMIVMVATSVSWVASDHPVTALSIRFNQEMNKRGLLWLSYPHLKTSQRPALQIFHCPFVIVRPATLSDRRVIIPRISRGSSEPAAQSSGR